METNKKSHADIYTADDIRELAISEEDAGRRANNHSHAIGRPVCTMNIEETMSADELAATLNMDREYARQINDGIYIVELSDGFAFAY